MERYRALRLKLLGVERSVLLALRSDGRINATLLRAIERDFDSRGQAQWLLSMSDVFSLNAFGSNALL